MKMDHATVIGRPWSVQVELTEGCTRLCTFCGLNGIRTAPGGYKFMTVMLAEKLASECAALCPTARYEFAMHGEPLMNPHYVDILKVFRNYLPLAQIQVTTNGNPLMKTQAGLERRVRELLGACDIDFLVVDTYEPERARLQAMLNAMPHDIGVVDFYADLVPAKISPWANHRRKGPLQKKVIILDDIGERTGEVKSRVIMNHAGNNGQKLDKPLAKTCTNPFRELTVCWDGNVNICCMDWGHEYVCGNVRTEPLEAIWWGPAFAAARTYLQARRREMRPCTRCNKDSGTRAGLLPKLPPPREYEANVIADVNRNSTPRNPRVTGGSPCRTSTCGT